MPTLAQIWEERGHQQGLQKGLQEGLKKGLKKGLQKGLQKGRQEGRQEGEAVRARADVLAILEARFGTVPEPLAQRIEALHDLSKLRELLKAAAIVPSLAAFQKTAWR